MSAARRSTILRWATAGPLRPRISWWSLAFPRRVWPPSAMARSARSAPITTKRAGRRTAARTFPRTSNRLIPFRPSAPAGKRTGAARAACPPSGTRVTIAPPPVRDWLHWEYAGRPEGRTQRHGRERRARGGQDGHRLYGWLDFGGGRWIGVSRGCARFRAGIPGLDSRRQAGRFRSSLRPRPRRNPDRLAGRSPAGGGGIRDFLPCAAARGGRS